MQEDKGCQISRAEYNVDLEWCAMKHRRLNFKSRIKARFKNDVPGDWECQISRPLYNLDLKIVREQKMPISKSKVSSRS